MKIYTKDKTSYIRLRLNIDLKKRYLEFCKTNSYKMSEKIRELLENDMKNGRK